MGWKDSKNSGSISWRSWAWHIPVAGSEAGKTHPLILQRGLTSAGACTLGVGGLGGGNPSRFAARNVPRGTCGRWPASGKAMSAAGGDAFFAMAMGICFTGNIIVSLLLPRVETAPFIALTNAGASVHNPLVIFESC